MKTVMGRMNQDERSMWRKTEWIWRMNVDKWRWRWGMNGDEEWMKMKNEWRWRMNEDEWR